MTKEEITICKMYLNDLDKTHGCNEYTLLMQLLEQEPCEDAVSRKAVLNLARDLEFGKIKGMENYKHRCIEIEDVEELPSVMPDLSSLRETNEALTKRVQYLEDMERYATPVKPARKVGKWVKYCSPRADEQHYQCTNCKDYVNFGKYSDYYTKDFKYCPHCGAEMQEVEHE